MEDARRIRGRGGVSTGYARTLTPPDYPMNRNVIYGSFSELEGWRESRADRAIAYTAIPKLILSSKLVIRTILLCLISLLRDCIYYINVFTIYLTHPIILTLYRDPSMFVICKFYRPNVYSVSSAIFITRDTGARFRYAAYACVRACMRAQVSEYARVHVHNGGV